MPRTETYDGKIYTYESEAQLIDPAQHPSLIINEKLIGKDMDEQIMSEVHKGVNELKRTVYDSNY